VLEDDDDAVEGWDVGAPLERDEPYRVGHVVLAQVRRVSEVSGSAARRRGDSPTLPLRSAAEYRATVAVDTGHQRHLVLDNGSACEHPMRGRRWCRGSWPTSDVPSTAGVTGWRGVTG
jgi:hypothetical protein